MKLTHTPVLLAALLAGCNLTHPRSDSTDAGQFVDTQILAHQQAIELAQDSLNNVSIETRHLPEGKLLSTPFTGASVEPDERSVMFAPRNPFSNGRQIP